MYDFEQTKTISIEHDAVSRAFDMPLMHTHECHELYFLASGKRRYLIDHSLYDVFPGNVVLIPKHHLHRTTMVSRKGHSRYVVYFSEEYLQEFIALVGKAAFERLMDAGCVQLDDDSVLQIHKLLHRMDRDAIYDAPFAAASLKAGLQEILLCLLRNGTKKMHTASPAAEKIQEVAHYISENYAMDISLEQAAAIACMEKTYFSKCFKNLTGFGFSEYVTRIRIQAAEQMLIETSNSVSDIASRCGFSSSNYFGDVFRRCNGVSPSEFRKKYRP